MREVFKTKNPNSRLNTTRSTSKRIFHTKASYEKNQSLLKNVDEVNHSYDFVQNNGGVQEVVKQENTNSAVSQDQSVQNGLGTNALQNKIRQMVFGEEAFQEQIAAQPTNLNNGKAEVLQKGFDEPIVSYMNTMAIKISAYPLFVQEAIKKKLFNIVTDYEFNLFKADRIIENHLQQNTFFPSQFNTDNRNFGPKRTPEATAVSGVHRGPDANEIQNLDSDSRNLVTENYQNWQRHINPAMPFPATAFLQVLNSLAHQPDCRDVVDPGFQTSLTCSSSSPMVGHEYNGDSGGEGSAFMSYESSSNNYGVQHTGYMKEEPGIPDNHGLSYSGYSGNQTSAFSNDFGPSTYIPQNRDFNQVPVSNLTAYPGNTTVHDTGVGRFDHPTNNNYYPPQHGGDQQVSAATSFYSSSDEESLDVDEPTESTAVTNRQTAIEPQPWRWTYHQ